MKNSKNKVLITCILCGLITSLMIGIHKMEEPKPVERPMSFGTVLEKVFVDTVGIERTLCFVDTDGDANTYEKIIVLKKGSAFMDKVQKGSQVLFKDYGGTQLYFGDIYKIDEFVINQKLR